MISRLLMLSAAALVAAIVPAAAQGVSPAVGRPLQSAQKLAASGSTAAAIAQVNEARTHATTPGERRAVGQMAAYIYTRAGQFAQAAQQLEANGAGPRELAPFYYKAGQLDKAIAAAKRAGGSDMQVIVAQSYLRKGDAGGAAKIYQDLIRSSGPRAEWLQNLAGAQFKAGDKTGYLNTTRQLIRLDPSPARWRTLLVSLKQQNMSDEAKLALFQLMQETGNLTEPADFQDMAKFAILGGQPGVARVALSKGVTAGVLPAGDAMVTRLVGAAQQRAAAAEAALPKLPRTAPGLFQAGQTLLGAERYPQAATVLAQAAAAGGPMADHARVLGGIASLRAGNAGNARQMFGAVPAGSDFKDIAELWSLYASTRGA